MRTRRCLPFLIASLISSGSIFPGAIHAAGWSDGFVSTVPVPLQHPPDLGFTIDRIAFATPTGECSSEFVDLLIEDFLHNQVEVIERQQMEKIIEELDFSSSGYIRPEDMKPLGEFMGASALVFANVQRCTTDQSRSHKTYNSKNGSSTTYYSTTTAHFKSSIRVVDTLTGRIHSAKVVEETKEETNSSREGYPEYPSTYELNDAAIRAGVLKVHRMLLPWWEYRTMRFFKDDKCGLKDAFRLVEIKDYDGALERSLAGVESCKSLPKPKPKLLARAHYDTGLVYLLKKEYEPAMSFFREAHSIRPGDRMQEGVTETQRAIRLAAAMAAFNASNAGRLAGEAGPKANEAGAQTVAAAADRPVGERLKELAALLDQGLITESEYQEKRQSILSGI